MPNPPFFSICMPQFFICFDNSRVEMSSKKVERLEGYDAFRAYVDEWSKDKKGQLFVYFSGSKDEATGNKLAKLDRF